MSEQTHQQRPVSWTTRRDEKARRMRVVEPWMTGPVLAREKIVEGLESVIVSGDRIVMEGDNQKQADFLSRSLVRVSAKKIAPMSYDVRDYAKLGLLYKLLHVDDPQNPTVADVEAIKLELINAIRDARRGATDLSNRLQSDAAKQTRKAGIAVRGALEAQWQNV